MNITYKFLLYHRYKRKKKKILIRSIEPKESSEIHVVYYSE